MFSKPPFYILHEPAESILTAQWAAAATADTKVRSDYGDLLTAARSYDRCRFWLISLRHRICYSDDFYHWYAHTFAPHAVRSLGHPLFIAYVNEPQQYNYAHDPILQRLQQVCAAYDLHLVVFDNHPAALRWLQYQQEYDPAPGEGPVDVK